MPLSIYGEMMLHNYYVVMYSNYVAICILIICTINCHIYYLQQIMGLTEIFEDEQSTMRSELTKKANHIAELKKENKVLIGTFTVIVHNAIMISMLKGQFVSIVLI